MDYKHNNYDQEVENQKADFLDFIALTVAAFSYAIPLIILIFGTLGLLFYGLSLVL